jgi:hypothetical protein
MSILGMSTTSEVTKCKEYIVLITLPAKDQMEQFKKAHAQFLQATSQVVARLQQVDLAEFIAHEQTTDNRMTSTTTSPSIVDLEKLLHAQALVIQNVLQLTSSYQQVLASQNVTTNETTNEQTQKMHTNTQMILEHVVVVASTMEFLVARSVQTKVKLQNRRIGFYFLT